MPAPLAMLGAYAGGKILQGGIDYLGGNAAAKAQKRAQTAARGDLTAGYGQGMGFQQPIYDTGLKNYQNLSDKYAAGGLSNPKMEAFSWDPNQVFQDPEYQASMRAGSEAINSGAAGRGMLYSGNTLGDLNRFGQDTFARRSDALYDRGFNAANTAFDQNYRSNAQDFDMGMGLANPGLSAAGNLSNMAVNQGQDLANNSLGMGDINAGKALRGSRIAGDLVGDLAGAGADYMLGRGLPKAGQAKRAL